MNTAGYSEKKISFINTKHRGTTSKVGRVGGLLSLFLKLKKSISILEKMFWLLWVKFLILNAVSRVAIICCRWDVYGSALIPRNLLYPKKVFFLKKIFHKKWHEKVLGDVHIITKAIEIYRKCLASQNFWLNCWKNKSGSFLLLLHHISLCPKGGYLNLHNVPSCDPSKTFDFLFKKKSNI